MINNIQQTNSQQSDRFTMLAYYFLQWTKLNALCWHIFLSELIWFTMLVFCLHWIDVVHYVGIFSSVKCCCSLCWHIVFSYEVLNDTMLVSYLQLSCFDILCCHFSSSEYFRFTRFSELFGFICCWHVLIGESIWLANLLVWLIWFTM